MLLLHVILPAPMCTVSPQASEVKQTLAASHDYRLHAKLDRIVVAKLRRARCDFFNYLMSWTRVPVPDQARGKHDSERARRGGRRANMNRNFSGLEKETSYCDANVQIRLGFENHVMSVLQAKTQTALPAFTFAKPETSRTTQLENQCTDAGTVTTDDL